MGNPVDDAVVRGRILLPPGERPARAARVVAWVEEVSRVDAPAWTVAEDVQHMVALPRDEEGLTFQIHLPQGSLDARLRYSVRAHVDVAGTGGITVGDFLSTISCPVTPDLHKTLTVTVRRV